MHFSRKTILSLGIIITAPVLIVTTYVLSVILRVSLAEQQVFGRSELIKMGTSRDFDQPPVLPYFGQKTYTVQYHGTKIVVFRQKINGYQHMYGSALADFELGTRLAKLLFAANEWAEFCCDYNGVSIEDLMDRRKDLANNRLGRKLGEVARPRQKMRPGQITDRS